MDKASQVLLVASLGCGCSRPQHHSWPILRFEGKINRWQMVSFWDLMSSRTPATSTAGRPKDKAAPPPCSFSRFISQHAESFAPERTPTAASVPNSGAEPPPSAAMLEASRDSDKLTRGRGREAREADGRQRQSWQRWQALETGEEFSRCRLLLLAKTMTLKRWQQEGNSDKAPSEETSLSRLWSLIENGQTNVGSPPCPVLTLLWCQNDSTRSWKLLWSDLDPKNSTTWGLKSGCQTGLPPTPKAKALKIKELWQLKYSLKYSIFILWGLHCSIFSKSSSIFEANRGLPEPTASQAALDPLARSARQRPTRRRFERRFFRVIFCMLFFPPHVFRLCFVLCLDFLSVFMWSFWSVFMCLFSFVVFRVFWGANGAQAFSGSSLLPYK